LADALLEVPAVLLDVAPMAVEVEDRVTDELARPVVGRLAAAVRLDDLDGDAVGDVELLLVRPPTESYRRRVLEQDDRVRDRSLRDGRGERALQLPGIVVANDA